MSLKSGQEIPKAVLDSGADNTVLHAEAGKRIVVTFLSFHETAGSGGNVELFLSDNDTSVAGTRIDFIQLGANERKAGVQAVLAPGKYLIAKPTAANISVHGGYTLATGGDV